MDADVLLGVVMVGAVGWPMARAWMSPLPGIAARELGQRLERSDSLLLLDVRTPQEFAGGLGHITGALNLPLAELGPRLDTVRSALAGMRDAGIVVVCHSGMRAESAARLLQKAEMAGVVVLSGGMLAWNSAGLPVVKGTG